MHIPRAPADVGVCLLFVDIWGALTFAPGALEPAQRAEQPYVILHPDVRVDTHLFKMRFGSKIVEYPLIVTADIVMGCLLYTSDAADE